uniref:Uncharacterized protein n=1 Tax=Anguilla anguilla TaxID=7936 RepID=A0A0E9WXU5_ANGAN
MFLKPEMSQVKPQQGKRENDKNRVRKVVCVCVCVCVSAHVCGYIHLIFRPAQSVLPMHISTWEDGKPVPMLRFLYFYCV